jgi:hypothetical protein
VILQKKKVFSPREKLETKAAIDLIFLQVAKDFSSQSCIRIGEKDRAQLSRFLGNTFFLFKKNSNDTKKFPNLSKIFPETFLNIFGGDFGMILF